MRIVIDLQAGQSLSRYEYTGQVSLHLAELLSRGAGDHEIWLLLNEAFPEGAREIRARFKNLVPQERIRTFDIPGPVSEHEAANRWRTRAAELVREHCIAGLAPDMVFIPSLFEGYRDDAVVSIGRIGSAQHTAVLVHDTARLQALKSETRDDAYQRFHYRRLQSLKNAGLVLTVSERSRLQVVELLSLSENQTASIVVAGSFVAPSGATRSESTQDVEDGGSDNQSLLDYFALETAVHRMFEIFETHHERLSEQRRCPAVVPERRLRLAYVSPLPPESTGIADYSAELVPELARYYEIDLITNQTEISDRWLSSNFPLREVGWFDANACDYDRILYHIGNSPFHSHMPGLLERRPGVVVLHDFFLAHLLLSDHPARLHQALYASHGYGAFSERDPPDRETAVWKYPANYGVVERAVGNIVHSNFSVKLAEQWYGREIARKFCQVPFLRATPVQRASRSEARTQLGVDGQDFVVCSFGLLGPSKLNHRLLRAWLNSKSAEEPRCQLVFVGANPDDSYSDGLQEAIESSGSKDQIRITGYAKPEIYRLWLAAADVAVQLRTRTRGETSGALFDCFVSGTPVVFNAHGSAAEVPKDVGFRLCDDFKNDELSTALDRLKQDEKFRDRLGKTQLNYVRKYHAPGRIGRLYWDAIERYAIESPSARENRLVSAIARPESGALPSDRDLTGVSEAASRACPGYQRQLLVDVSAIARHDLGTGIQRVVRAQLHELLVSPPDGYRVEPVYLTQVGGEWQYYYAREFALGLLEDSSTLLRDEPVDIRTGDVFHGLDLFGGGVVEAGKAGLYAKWRARGVHVYFAVYDLLPVLRSDWFPQGAPENHEAWLHTIARDANGLVCISASVADELEEWVRAHGIERLDDLAIGYAHLGADIEASVSSKGLPETASAVLAQLAKWPTFLMVGTVEPRKGYLQAIAALEQLWHEGTNVNLVIVGKIGWEHLPDSCKPAVAEIAERLRRHPELGRRLLWLDGATDEYLEKVYSASSCLLAASEAEGFGLPLIEAARHRLPIVARDIPVFREVAGNNAFYFHGPTWDDLADALRTWLRLHITDDVPRSEGISGSTWSDSAEKLKSLLFGTEAWRHTIESVPENDNSLSSYSLGYGSNESDLIFSAEKSDGTR